MIMNLFSGPTPVIRCATAITLSWAVLATCAAQTDESRLPMLKAMGDYVETRALVDDARTATSTWYDPAGEWSVDAIVGAAELVYLTLELHEEAASEKREWIVKTLKPVVDHAKAGAYPKDRRRAEAYERAVILFAVLEVQRPAVGPGPDVSFMGKTNAMHTLLKARNAFRKYDFDTVRECVRQFKDNPQPAHFCQRYSLARMAEALKTLGKLSESIERELVSSTAPPIDIGICTEITAMLTMADFSPAMFVKKRKGDLYLPRTHTPGLFLAVQMQYQPPLWRSWTPHIYVRQVLPAVGIFQGLGTREDFGRAATLAEKDWYSRLTTLTEKQTKQVLEEDAIIFELGKAGSRAEMQRFIADPIAFIESRHEIDRRKEMEEWWRVLWDDWARLENRDRT